MYSNRLTVRNGEILQLDDKSVSFSEKNFKMY